MASKTKSLRKRVSRNVASNSSVPASVPAQAVVLVVTYIPQVDAVTLIQAPFPQDVPANAAMHILHKAQEYIIAQDMARKAAQQNATTD